MEKWKEVYGSENVWIGVSKKNGAWWTETDNIRIFYSSLFANGNGNYQDNCAFQRYVSRGRHGILIFSCLLFVPFET